MIVLYSILDSIAKKTSCSHCFLHGASLHQQLFSRTIFTLVSRIFVKLAHICSCWHVQSYDSAPCHNVLKDGIVFSSPPYTVQFS